MSESLTKANGEYNCAPVNAYARQYEKTAAKRASEVFSAPYRSEQRCEARCDALAWREEILTRYKYQGSWACSVPAVGIWNSVAVHYSGYNDGKNTDSCTCIAQNGAQLSFTPPTK